MTRGTMTTTTPAWHTASVVFSVAESKPLFTRSATSVASSGSSWTCERRALTVSTTWGLISQPITRYPCRAYCTASGKPILPRPTTATVEEEREKFRELFCMLCLHPHFHFYLLFFGLRLRCHPHNLIYNLQDRQAIFTRDRGQDILVNSSYHIFIFQAQRLYLLNLEPGHCAFAYPGQRA